ncbi:MAG TPA: hypothetical protein VHM70_01760 [Polyangiaceae bacterium]|jgi:SAM-dependent methyltransferase|nr:hypothetical protein [Polyangiaceae bacterium]
MGVSAADLPLLLDLIRKIQKGHGPPDYMFDRFLPLEMRLVSGQHWTPIDVALRAAQWLREYRVKTVLDIGSGAGKFCVVAALASEASFAGMEHRPPLVRAARALARTFGVADRIEFACGEFDETSVPIAEALYLFNPFGENLYGREGQLDNHVHLSGTRYRRDVAAVERLLNAVPGGTFVMTYNGFGGRVPAGYELIRVDRELPNVLAMWRKRNGLPLTANQA